MSKSGAENNHNRRFMTILIAITLACIAFFVISLISTCANNGYEKEIIIVQDGETVEDMQIKGLEVHPSESVDYKVLFKAKVTGTYNINMDFTEVEDGGLKEFIVVTIKNGDTLIYEQSLLETLSGEAISFDCNITANEPYVIDVKYKMPIEVGNEAMNAKASFDIKFTIKMI